MDGLEQEYAGRAEVRVINVTTAVGQRIVREQRIRSTPTMLVWDGNGNVVYNQARVDAEEIRAAVDALLE